jgi:DNA-directed RNA polymerase specialized sigma24 family protein
MAESPLWDAYASRQRQLSERTTVDDLAWGLEASLNELLDQAPAELVDEAQVKRIGENESRQARYRRALLIRYFAYQPSSIEPLAGLEARSDLNLLKQRLRPSQNMLLIAVGSGASSAEIAAEARISEQAARARISRTRSAARCVLGTTN